MSNFPKVNSGMSPSAREKLKENEARLKDLIAVSNNGSSPKNPTPVPGRKLTRKQVEDPNTVLIGANLSNVNLAGINLSGRNLSKANLRGATLVGVNLFKANLTDANLTKANLTDAKLAGADLTNAHFNGSTLVRATFVNLGTQEQGYYSSGVGINSQAGTLGGAYMIGAKQVDAITLTTISNYANVTGTDFTGANLQRAILMHLSMPKAKLQGANLRGADLQGADLTDTQLFAADLRGANLMGAEMLLTKLYEADLRGADLRGANLFDPTITAQTKIDDKTQGLSTTYPRKLPPAFGLNIIYPRP